MKPITYIAAPYSHPDPSVVESRMRVVSKYQAVLAKAGVLTVSPLEKHYLLQYGDLAGDYVFWGDLSRSLLSRCDALCVIQLPGWEESVGVQDEIRLARSRGIPINYVVPAPPFSGV